jgi:hypothetical protein
MTQTTYFLLNKFDIKMREFLFKNQPLVKIFFYIIDYVGNYLYKIDSSQ